MYSKIILQAAVEMIVVGEIKKKQQQNKIAAWLSQ